MERGKGRGSRREGMEMDKDRKIGRESGKMHIYFQKSEKILQLFRIVFIWKINTLHNHCEVCQIA